MVIGTGPCGLLAALVLAQMGFRPIILERGKVVRERTKDTWGLWRRSVLNPESNVQFGEGGAGTFSDGKLYSQIKDPQHRGRKVLTEFVKAGAPEEILYVAKPHIGTFRLVTIVESLRATDRGARRRVSLRQPGRRSRHRRRERPVAGSAAWCSPTARIWRPIMSCSRSATARATRSQMLHARGVAIEAKPFSIGVRIEHPQSLIDRCRYGEGAGHPLLGAADYKLVHHGCNGRSVYSFCMCPGGTVVAAASEPGRVVTNGMSQYSRAERNANAGHRGRHHAGGLSGRSARRHRVPAPLGRARVRGRRRRTTRRRRSGSAISLRRKASSALGDVVPSYRPGVTPADLADCLPDYAVAAIREALPAFDRQIKGFALADAVMTGVETRTSSPIRIPRDDTLQSLNTRGLYPAGEGAGYAGGILSAGVDGIRIAEAVALSMAGKTS